MQDNQSNDYLESKVLTAPPHKLQLMLIEGGIRFGRQARGLLEAGEVEAASAPLLRMIDVVGEMLVGVRGSENEINLKLAELYLFVFRRLAQAKLDNDLSKLNEALGVLEYERETWQLVCEKLAQEGADSTSDKPPAAGQADARHTVPLKVHQPLSTSTNLSLEA